MKLDSEEILKCLCFVILGYFIAMMFSRMCSCGNGFRVGGAERCQSLPRQDCIDAENCNWNVARQGRCQGSSDCSNFYELQCTDNYPSCTWNPPQNGGCTAEQPAQAST